MPGSPAVALRTCGHWPRRRRGQSSRYGKTKRGSPVKAARAFQDRTDPASLIRGARSDVPYRNRHSQGSRRCPVGADVVLVNIDFCPLARVTPVRRKRRCPVLASHRRRAGNREILRAIGPHSANRVANPHRARDATSPRELSARGSDRTRSLTRLAAGSAERAIRQQGLLARRRGRIPRRQHVLPRALGQRNAGARCIPKARHSRDQRPRHDAATPTIQKRTTPRRARGCRCIYQAAVGAFITDHSATIPGAGTRMS